MVILILFQVTLFVAGGILFGIYKDSIHVKIETLLGQDALHGDSLSIEKLDYASTLLLQPRIEMNKVKIWGLGARDLAPTFDIDRISIDLSWWRLIKMLYDASVFFEKGKFLTIKNEQVRVLLKGMHLRGGKITMHRTPEGHNHRLFRPPKSRIEQFARGEKRMAGGFEITRFEASNITLDYLKTSGSNPEEALPKRYDVHFDHIEMKLSSDSLKAYFEHFQAKGTVGSIRVRDNEGLTNRPFQAFGEAELIKLNLEQKLNDATGFDLVSTNFNVLFDDLKVNATGVLSTLNERMRIDIDFKSETGSEDRKNEALLSFLELTLSDRFLNVIKSYEPLGELQFDGKVFSKNNEYGGAIKIDMGYKAQNTSFKFRFFENGKRHTISDLELDGLFQVGGDSPSYISANIQEGLLYGDQSFEANIVLDNVFRREFLDSVQQLTQPPLASVRFESINIDFPRFLEFLEFEKFENATGFIDFKDFHFSGPIASLSRSYGDLDYGGIFGFRDVGFYFERPHIPLKLDVKESNGEISLVDLDAKPRFRFNLNGYPIAIQNGSVTEIVPYIFNENRQRLKLEDFLIEIPQLRAQKLKEDLKDIGSINQVENPLDLPSIRSQLSRGIEALTDHLEVQGLTLAFPDLDINNLYQVDSINGFFPTEMSPLEAQVSMSVNEEIDLSLKAQHAEGQFSHRIKIQERNKELRVYSNTKANTTDLSALACDLGINLNLANHLNEKLALNGEWTLIGTVNDSLMEMDVQINELALQNENLDIDVGVNNFQSTLNVDLNNLKVQAPLDLDLGLHFGDEPLDARLSLTEDSIIFQTLGQQQLNFQTAKRYLSIICEIDQNLRRLDNVEGLMKFETFIEESRKNIGFDDIIAFNRVGSFEIENVAFDFLKGDEGIRFSDVNGRLDYNNLKINIQRFHGKYEESDFEIYDTQAYGLLEFVLLGQPLTIDTFHLTSNLLDLNAILSGSDDMNYACEEEITTITTSAVCQQCLQRIPSDDSPEDNAPIAFSLINFLGSSTINYADAYFERILFRPIAGSEVFEIDNLNASGNLAKSMMTINDPSANMYDGIIFQYEPLEVLIKSEDTLTVQGAYTVKDLELQEVVQNLNNKSVKDLRSDKLDFKGKLSMDFDFLDTLTATTDITSLEFRINNMQVVEGSAKELTKVGLDKKWKENVPGFQRLLATLFLGNFQKKFRRPTNYVLNLENLVLDTGWVSFDVLEFYNNQVNAIATGSYEINSGARDIDLLLQRNEKKYNYDEFVSVFCKGGFLTYFNITDDREKVEWNEPLQADITARQKAYSDCLINCPCSQEECTSQCEELFPPLERTLEVPNKITLKLKDKRLKEFCD